MLDDVSADELRLLLTRLFLLMLFRLLPLLLLLAITIRLR